MKKIIGLLLLTVVVFLAGCSGGLSSDKILIGIEITKAPDKIEYFIGASLDLTGIEVSAIYSDKTKERVYIGVKSVSGFDSSEPGIINVIVAYNEHTADFSVTVKNVALVSIEITAEPVKKAYWMYELIELDGIEVKAAYNDGSSEIIDVDELTVSGFNRAAAGEQHVTVSFGGKSAAFTVTVTASKFTIYFDKNGGDSEADPESKTVTQPEENVGSLPAAPVKSGGYHFTGWNTHQDGSGINFTADSLVTDSYTVYAQWFKPTVTFNSNGGSAVLSQSINYGSTAAEPPNPVKNAYALKFGGWYTDNTTFNNKWNFTDTVTADIALYAKWSPYELGDTGPGGGKVFYRDENGFALTGFGATKYHYLEASPNDLGNAEWGASGDNIKDKTGYTTGDEIGDGKINTRILVDFLNSEKEKGRAAQLADAFTYNGLSDWFLPSANELNTLFENRAAAGITLQLGSSSYYWSSTEGDTRQNALAYYWSTTNNTINFANRNRQTSNIVRAIRAF